MNRALKAWINMTLQDEHSDFGEVFQQLLRLSWSSICELEQDLPLLSHVMSDLGWWEQLYRTRFPACHQRIQHQPQRLNARHFLSVSLNFKDIWCSHQMWMNNNFQVSRIPNGARIVLAVGDEFGLGSLLAIPASQESPRFLLGHFVRTVEELNHHSNVGLRFEWTLHIVNQQRTMHVSDAILVPLQRLVLLRMRHKNRFDQDSVVVLHLNQADDGAAIHQCWIDSSSDLPCLAAIERSASPLHCHGVTAMCINLIYSAEVFLIDQVYQQQEKGMTSQSTLHETEVAGTAFVLDAFLLLATMQGTLLAKPRNNPHSTYFVGNLDLCVTHMVSLYNVVAFTFANGTMLQVFRVERIAIDPFIKLSLIFQETQLQPHAHRPLLFGPFVLFQQTPVELSDDEEEEEREEKEPWVPARIRNWHRNKRLMLERYKLSKGIPLSPKKEQPIKEEKKKVKVKKRAAEWVLANYETRERHVINFDDAVIPAKWRFSHVKLANHRYWVITVYRHHTYLDLIVSPK